MSRARENADGARLDAPLASPAFTGTPTGITAAHLEAGVLPSDVTGGSGLTLGGTVGQISAFGVTTAPTGWLVCNGASDLLRTGTYATLFGVIGTVWGAVDGTHFTLPDLRDEFLRGVSASLSLATVQGHQVMEHYHWMESWAGQGGDGAQNPRNAGYGAAGPYGNSIRSRLMSSSTTAADTSNIGTETRPQNITVQWCIKF